MHEDSQEPRMIISLEILKTNSIHFVVVVVVVDTVPLWLVSNQGATSSRNNAGRLEILLDRNWGTVCSDGFDSNDAAVACRQLGFDGHIFYTSGNIEAFG